MTCSRVSAIAIARVARENAIRRIQHDMVRTIMFASRKRNGVFESPGSVSIYLATPSAKVRTKQLYTARS